jgi:hypothetical protein
MNQGDNNDNVDHHFFNAKPSGIQFINDIAPQPGFGDLFVTHEGFCFISCRKTETEPKLHPEDINPTGDMRTPPVVMPEIKEY